MWYIILAPFLAIIVAADIYMCFYIWKACHTWMREIPIVIKDFGDGRKLVLQHGEYSIRMGAHPVRWDKIETITEKEAEKILKS